MADDNSSSLQMHQDLARVSSSSTSSSIQNYVIDCGTKFTKVGLSDSDTPQEVIPTLIGKSKHQSIMIGMSVRSHYIGDDAQHRRGILRLTYPMEHGCVTNWDDMELLWYDIFFKEMKMRAPQNANLFIADSTQGGDVEKVRTSRETMAEILFETFNFNGLFFGLQPVLALYSTGNMTGISLDSGDSTTRCVCVNQEGNLVQQSVREMKIGGKDLSASMMGLLTESGFSFVTGAEREILHDIKEATCYVAPDSEAEEMKKLMEKPSSVELLYELPDGYEMSVKDVRFRCPEKMFDRSKSGYDYSLQGLICSSLEGCGSAVRTDTYFEDPSSYKTTMSSIFSKIVVSGGNTLFPGLETRLRKELLSKVIGAQEDVSSFDRISRCLNETGRRSGGGDGESSVVSLSSSSFDIETPKVRKFAAWNGASIVSSLDSFQNQWVLRKSDYEESGGARIIKEKCVN